MYDVRGPAPLPLRLGLQVVAKLRRPLLLSLLILEALGAAPASRGECGFPDSYEAVGCPTPERNILFQRGAARVRAADRAAFERLDRDGDGRLGLAEFLGGYSLAEDEEQLETDARADGEELVRAAGRASLAAAAATAPAKGTAPTEEQTPKIGRPENAYALPLLITAGLAASAASASAFAARYVSDPARKALLRGWVPKLTFVFAWVAFGVAAGVLMQGWHFGTALYVVVQIVTTIGYGDLTVYTPKMKAFTAIYVFITLLVISTWVTEAASNLMEAASANVLQRRMRKLEDELVEEDAVVHHEASRPGQVGLLAGESMGNVKKAFEDDAGRVIVNFVLCMFFVASGTVFYALAEACSCSYGFTRIEGCVEGPTCPQTGGAVMHWVDSFYMSVITLTTVGFGDLSPKTELGRAFGVPWMLFGVVATGMFLSSFGEVICSQQRESRVLDRISKSIFLKIDTNNDGELSRSEFQTYALLKFDLVSDETLRQIGSMFDVIDKDGNGALTLEEITQHFDAE